MSASPLTNPFAIDIRSLAALRVGLALCLLWNLAERVPDLAVLYTDTGILPRADLLSTGGDVYRGLSLSLAGGALWSQALIFALTAAAAVALLVGYHTGVAAFVCWILLSSIQLRNPYLVFGDGVFLRMLLFWGMLLPLGAVWSLDHGRSTAAVKSGRTVFSVPSCGLYGQIALVFIVAGLAKWSQPHWSQGLGVAYSLDYDLIATRLGQWLAGFPALCSLITYMVVALELGGTALLFTPLLTTPARLLAIAAMTCMLVGFSLTLRVGLFPWVAMVGLLAFVPGAVWDRLGPGARIDAPADGKTQRNPARQLSVGAWARAALGVAAMAYILMWTIGLWSSADYRAPNAVAWFGEALNLRQRWGMFTRLPSTGWLSLPGQLVDGTTVDLFVKGGPLPSYDEAAGTTGAGERPALISATFKSVPWLAFFLNMTEQPERASDQMQAYGRYLCREWNKRETGPRQLSTFEIVYMNRAVEPRSSVSAAPTYNRQTLWTHGCFS